MNECVERGQGFTGIQLVSAGKFLPAPGYLFSYWLVAGRNEQGGLLSCDVHAARAVSAFQTKLSTACSEINLRQGCVIGCIRYCIVALLMGTNRLRCAVTDHILSSSNARKRYTA